MSYRLACVVLALLASGCSSNVTNGTGGGGGAGGSGGSGSGAAGGNGGDDPDACDYHGFEATTERADVDGVPGVDPLFYVYVAGGTRAGGVESWVQFILPDDVGYDWSMPQSLGFPPRRDGDYGGCPCVVIGEGDETYIPFEGKLDITATGFEGDRFVGTLTHMKFGSSGFILDDLTWGPFDADGDVWCVDRYEFDVEIGSDPWW